MSEKQYVCELDKVEEQLKKEGKTYFRIGRAIFVVEKVEEDVRPPDLVGTPLGAAIAITGQTETQIQGLIKSIFLPTGYLRIRVIGDPDAGLGWTEDEILLTGYRYALDDVMINRELYHTVHGDHYEMLRTLLHEIEHELSWRCQKYVPDRETRAYFVKDDPKLRKQVKKLTKKLKEIINELEKRAKDVGAIRLT